MSVIEIEGQISIRASYDDKIEIILYDVAASTNIVTIELTNEQFVNAAMNRLAHCETKRVEIRHPERIGKRMLQGILSFPVPEYADREEVRELAKFACEERYGEGYVPDLSFSSQDSFTYEGNQRYAHTRVRTWMRNPPYPPDITGSSSKEEL